MVGYEVIFFVGIVYLFCGNRLSIPWIGLCLKLIKQISEYFKLCKMGFRSRDTNSLFRKKTIFIIYKAMVTSLIVYHNLYTNTVLGGSARLSVRPL